MFFDEPSRGVDVQAKRQIFDIIWDQAERGLAAIFVSTELEEVLEVADRILVMRQGRIVAEVDPAATTLSELYPPLHGRTVRMSVSHEPNGRGRARWSGSIKTYPMEMILVVLIVVLIFTAPGFASVGNLLNVLRTGVDARHHRLRHDRRDHLRRDRPVGGRRGGARRLHRRLDLRRADPTSWAPAARRVVGIAVAVGVGFSSASR